MEQKMVGMLFSSAPAGRASGSGVAQDPPDLFWVWLHGGLGISLQEVSHGVERPFVAAVDALPRDAQLPPDLGERKPEGTGDHDLPVTVRKAGQRHAKVHEDFDVHVHHVLL